MEQNEKIDKIRNKSCVKPKSNLMTVWDMCILSPGFVPMSIL